MVSRFGNARYTGAVVRNDTRSTAHKETNMTLKRATERATACNARRKGQFQMCRAADAGPYCSTNVRIDRTEANSVEAQVTKRRLRLERQASQSIVYSS